MKHSNWKICAAVILLFVSAASGNPIPGPMGAHVYLSSEHLEITVSQTDAVFKATFTFSAQDLKGSDKDLQQTFMQLPIWFPQQKSDDSSVTGFWSAFGTNALNAIRPKYKDAFEKAVALKVFFGKRPMPVNGFAMLYQDGDQRPFQFFKQRGWEPFLESQEPGFCGLLFHIDGMDELVESHVPAVVSYRQPLLENHREGRFFYLPFFENLPESLSTTNTNRYSVALTASGCSLTITTGQQNFKVADGHSVTLAPQNRQAIRATAVQSQAK